jgi:hypothetical protein
MNGQKSRAALDRCSAARIVANATCVAAIAGILLTHSVIPASAADDQPAAGAGSRQVVIDCKETDKKVKLAPNEGSVTFVFQNCTCWRRSDSPKQYVDQFVKGAIALANAGKPIRPIIAGVFVPVRSETLAVPIGETKTTEFYCYPEDSIKKLWTWTDSLSKPRN